MFSKSPKSYLKPEDCRRLIKDLKARGEKNINKYLKVSFSNCINCKEEETSSVNNFELLANGITVRYNGNTPGETGEVNGITYTAVDETMLRAMDPAVDDFSIVATTLISDMSGIFEDKSDFNQDISSWDTINVTTMARMFKNAINFNQSLAEWIVTGVTNMQEMFFNAQNFIQDISSWHVQHITTLQTGFDTNSNGSWATLQKPFFGETNNGSIVSPYCGPLVFDRGREPLTYVQIADMTNRIVQVANNAVRSHSIYTHKTATLQRGQTYTMTVEGNTVGNFVNRFAVFIDFNKNETFGSPGSGTSPERVEGNNLENSTGEDGKQATFNIVVPVDAVLGPNVMRVKKLFGISNFLDGCLGTDYGHAHEYTVNIIE